MCKICFLNSKVTRIPQLDFRHLGINNGHSAFASSAITTVDKILVSETNKFSTNMFLDAVNLTSLTFEGVIGNNLDLHWSTSLSKDSITNIVNTLSTTTTVRLTLTLSMEAVNKAFESQPGANDGTETDAWFALIDERLGWSISTM